jgi:hypothetical protein
MASKVKQLPPDPTLRAARSRVLRAHYPTIHDFAIALVKLIHHRDVDGREIGYDYGFIHRAILRKFPIITSKGPHRGKPTRMPYKELQKVTGELNREGVKLPFRPRRKSKKSKKKSAH